jgi:hypothetical protein
MVNDRPGNEKSKSHTVANLGRCYFQLARGAPPPRECVARMIQKCAVKERVGESTSSARCKVSNIMHVVYHVSLKWPYNQH